MDESQCESCEYFGGQSNVGKRIGNNPSKWPCYMDHSIPIGCYCGSYSKKKLQHSMIPENHPCPACSMKCGCGVTRLDGTHISPHPVFRFLDEVGRRVHIKDHHDRCVHKCPTGYGENWKGIKRGI